MVKSKTLLVGIFSIYSAFLCHAQQETSRSAVHVDAFGAGWYTHVTFLRALRYECFLVSKEKHACMIEAGIGVSKWTDFSTRFNPDIIVPVSLAYMYGKARSHPIVSVGMIYSNYTYFNTRKIETDRYQQVSLSWSAGYRYTHPNGFTGSIYYIGIADGLDVIRYGGGLSLGYRFKKSKK